MARGRWRRLLALLAIGVGIGGCASAPRGQETLDAALWIQTSVEYRGAARTAYAAAARGLEAALADSGWTAALEQTGDFATLPPAIIVDIDETVLDNAPYAARLIRDGTPFDTVSWRRWVREARADPVPGALDFLAGARARGVTIFYVTNRAAVVDGATRRNLERDGFPLEDDLDTILTLGERPGWDPDKGTRRAFIAKTYRILLLIGDDFGDFLSGVLVPPADRAALARRHAALWGRRWIVLPNPTYGSWRDALTGFRHGLSTGEVLALRAGYLDPKE
ncbi:MAG: 5'-nucleotidase, lipoprotein e(P4) family [Gemmatimonadota bacterium]